VLAFVSGPVVVALAWRVGTLLLRVMPIAPRQSPFLAAFFYSAGLEESLKLVALLALWCAVRARSPRDLLPIATGIACGFASAENVLALWSAAHPATAFVERMTMALLAHIAYAAVTAVILAAVAPPLSARGIGAALLVAILLHGAYDAAAFADLSWATLALLAALGAFAVVTWWRRLQATS
jgi:hypothetical protein